MKNTILSTLYNNNNEMINTLFLDKTDKAKEFFTALCDAVQLDNYSLLNDNLAIDKDKKHIIQFYIERSKNDATDIKNFALALYSVVDDENDVLNNYLMKHCNKVENITIKTAKTAKKATTFYRTLYIYFEKSQIHCYVDDAFYLVSNIDAVEYIKTVTHSTTHKTAKNKKLFCDYAFRFVNSYKTVSVDNVANYFSQLANLDFNENAVKYDKLIKKELNRRTKEAVRQIERTLNETATA